MKRTGIIDLPLHYGKAPYWLFSRMVKLAKPIVTIIIDEYGTEEFLSRISDTYWFQSLGCVLGFDWHSSGVTTVVTGALKEAIDPSLHGITVCGGKGSASRRTPDEIAESCEVLGLSSQDVGKLTYVSRITSKIDNTAIQSGHPLYHHAIFVSEKGEWAVVQQGMNTTDRTARRYHWFSRECESFVVEPHKAIVGDKVRDKVLNLTSRDSEGCRKVIVDLAKEEPRRIYRALKSIRPKYQSTLEEWLSSKRGAYGDIEYLRLPSRVNWNALRKAYETQVRSFEELIQIQGLGPATVRGLALISELIYGEKPSWRDPVKYSFAFGGKDGVPFPVDKRAMDEAIGFLREVVRNAKLGDKDKVRILMKLNRMASRL
ncbi:DUF763 domain-containing protein [Candidatus Bathyarchaeota archaeon]|nr:MAG: DUF763 domain-containing protein [Candidatus Bathyarchaeota archaeon]